LHRQPRGSRLDWPQSQRRSHHNFAPENSHCWGAFTGAPQLWQ
jgi:hypothetical protein